MPVSTARSNRSGSAALGLHDDRLDKNGAALAKVAGVLAPQRQRAEVPDGDAHARGLLLDEGARAGGADLVHLEVGDLAALRGDILRVLPADFKDGVGLGHPDACARSR